MAVTEFCTLQLKADATLEDAGSDAGKRWAELMTLLKQAPGCQKIFFGRKIEDQGVGLFCIVWRDLDAHLGFNASDASGPLAAGLAPLINGAAMHHLNADATPVLSAPATEVFTAFGVEAGFAANLALFAGRVDAERPAGYYGEVHGEVLEEIASDAAGADKGPAAMLSIGWESKAAHLEAKAKPGAIAENIGLLRGLVKGADLYHVNFKEQ